MFWTSMTTETSKNPPISKLHIELLEPFEDSRTFKKFIEPLLPKIELNKKNSNWTTMVLMYQLFSYDFISLLKSVKVSRFFKVLFRLRHEMHRALSLLPRNVFYTELIRIQRGAITSPFIYYQTVTVFCQCLRHEMHRALSLLPRNVFYTELIRIQRGAITSPFIYYQTVTVFCQWSFVSYFPPPFPGPCW